MKNNPIEIFTQNGGYLKMNEAIKQGITRYMLYSMRDKGDIEQLSRGLYKLKDIPETENIDIITICLKYPNSVISLISALSFYNITTQIPHEVSIAIGPRDSIPYLEYPKIDVHKFSTESYKAGVREIYIDGAKIKIYSPEKTIVDCFKFRNKLGMDIVIEALKFYKSRMKFNLKEIVKYAKICRVENVMKPYLEVII
jgi:predicted transcriptional regulator of viral defense system